MEDFVSKDNLWKAIRNKCVDDCCGGSKREAKFCTIHACPLYVHRFGRKPALGDYSYREGDEQYPSMEMAEIHRKRMQEQGVQGGSCTN